MADSRTDVTQLLLAHSAGEAGAFEQLVGLVYDRLRDMAHRQLFRGRPGVELQTTALVHELYFKLVDRERGWRDRGHFFAACAAAMRHILVDEARRRVSLKRGGGVPPLPLDDELAGLEGEPEWLLRLDQLMDQLAIHDARLVQVFECRYFCGYTLEETAEALDVSKRTAEREWARARGWLKHALDA